MGTENFKKSISVGEDGPEQVEFLADALAQSQLLFQGMDEGPLGVRCDLAKIARSLKQAI